jgi:hypothetical protein
VFSHFLFIDWSAANSPTGKKPRRDAIWLAHGEQHEAGKITTHYFPTRQSAYDYIRDFLAERVRRRQRTLCGLDIGYGYPAGLASLLGFSGPEAWRQLWAYLHQQIADDDRNRNNRYTVAEQLNRRLSGGPAPFWGHPPGRTYEYLSPKRHVAFPLELGEFELAEYRIVDQRQRGLQSAWKLHYPASVGSQILMGLPYLYRLRFQEPALQDHSRVWPQETGFSASPLPDHCYILHAEIWPGILAIPPEPGVIRDRLQVQGMVNWARQLAAAGKLFHYFLPPTGITPGELQTIRREEGWVLGIR